MGTALGLSIGIVSGTARLLVVVLSVTTLGPMLHGAHDPDLGPVIVAHDDGLRHVRAVPSADDRPDGEHCVACHFVRSSRGPASWELTGLVALAPGHLLYHRDGALTAAPNTAPLPARAPPSL